MSVPMPKTDFKIFKKQARLCKTKEKYILTGWYNFKGDRKGAPLIFYNIGKNNLTRKPIMTIYTLITQIINI